MKFDGIQSNSKRECSVPRQQSRPRSSRRSTSKSDQNGQEKKNTERSHRLPRKSRYNQDSGEKFLGTTQKQQTIELEQQRAISSTTKIVKGSKRSEVHVQCTCGSKKKKNKRLENSFLQIWEEAWRTDSRTTTKTQVTIEKGC